MGKYSITVEKSAQKELQAIYKSGDKASVKRIEIIFEELSEHPQTGVGKPEQLKFGCQVTGPDRLIKKTG